MNFFDIKTLPIALLCSALAVAPALASPQYVLRFSAAGLVANGAPQAPADPVGPGPSGLAIGPASLSFGQTWVSLLSDEQVVQVTNPTAAARTVLSAALTSGAENFRITNECGAVAPGGACRVVVLFAPNVAGSLTGTLVITTDAGSASVALSGVAKAPSVTLSSPVFADAVYPATSSAVTRLTNEGFEAITLTPPARVNLSIPRTRFVVGPSACGTTLAAGASCDTPLTTTSTPLSAGLLSSTLTVQTSAGNRTVNLSAMVIAGQLSTGLSADTSGSQYTLPAFPARDVNTSSEPRSIVLANTGNAPLNLSGISLVSRVDFEQSNNCGGPLQPGQSCTVNVSFTPTAAVNAADTLLIGHDGLGGQSVAVSGNGVPVVTTFTITPKVGPNGGNLEVSRAVAGVVVGKGSVILDCPNAYLFTGVSESIQPSTRDTGNNITREMLSGSGTFSCQLSVGYEAGAGFQYLYRTLTYTVP
jgi:hypothetical protein